MTTWQCKNCEGSGKLKVRDGERERELINGTLQFKEFPCRACAGSGIVDDKQHGIQMRGVHAFQSAALKAGRSTVVRFIPKQISE